MTQPGLIPPGTSAPGASRSDPRAGAEWTIDVRHLVRRMRRRWRVAALVAVPVLAGAVAAGVLAPQQYTATASVAVSPIRISSTGANPAVNINTERAVLASNQVAVLAAEALGDVTPEELADGRSVAAPSGSEVLQVSVTAANPTAAADRANALAAAYLEFRSAGALEIAKPAIAALEARIDAVNPTNTSKISELRAELVALENVGDGTGRVIGSAVAPGSPSSLGLHVFAVGGLVGGVLLGLLVALLWDRLDGRLRSAGRLSELFGAPGVLLRRRGDEEAARWILRAVRGASASGPAVATVVGVEPAAVVAVLATVAEHARRAGVDVRVVDAGALAGDGFEQRWASRAVSSGVDDLVLVDASRVASAAQRATLLDDASAVVVVGCARDRVRRLQALVPEEAPAVVPVFVQHATASAHPAAKAPTGLPSVPRELAGAKR